MPRKECEENGKRLGGDCEEILGIVRIVSVEIL
jgi:hypothetical protein